MRMSTSAAGSTGLVLAATLPLRNHASCVAGVVSGEKVAESGDGGVDPALQSWHGYAQQLCRLVCSAAVQIGELQRLALGLGQHRQRPTDEGGGVNRIGDGGLVVANS